MKLMYETKAISIGGREGHVIFGDAPIDLKMSAPNSGKTNPEQLFGAGYSACFESSIAYIARRENIHYTKSQVIAKVQLYSEENKIQGFKLAVTLIVSLPELSDDDAWKLINAAHQFCPYSRAIRNNVEVKLELENN